MSHPVATKTSKKRRSDLYLQQQMCHRDTISYTPFSTKVMWLLFQVAWSSGSSRCAFGTWRQGDTWWLTTTRWRSRRTTTIQTLCSGSIPSSRSVDQVWMILTLIQSHHIAGPCMNTVLRPAWWLVNESKIVYKYKYRYNIVYDNDFVTPGTRGDWFRYLLQNRASRHWLLAECVNRCVLAREWVR